jgi:hypothetical protein
MWHLRGDSKKLPPAAYATGLLWHRRRWSVHPQPLKLCETSGAIEIDVAGLLHAACSCRLQPDSRCPQWCRPPAYRNNVTVSDDVATAASATAPPPGACPDC